jgi:hypothetical protein
MAIPLTGHSCLLWCIFTSSVVVSIVGQLDLSQHNRDVVVVIVWQLDLQLPVQSVPITTKVVSSNPVHGEVYSIRNPPIKLTPIILVYMNELGVRCCVQSPDFI